MSSTTPSATRNSASLDRLQVEKGRSWSMRAGQGDLLDLLALGQGELRRPATGVLRGQGVEPVVVEVVDAPLGPGPREVKATLAIWATSMPWADSSTIWALRHRTTDPDERRTIRSKRVALVVGDLSDAYPFAHLTSSFARGQFCATRESKWWTRPSNVAGHGTSRFPPLGY